MSSRQQAASTDAPTQAPMDTMLGRHKPGAFDAKGGIGKQFTEHGAIGGMAQKMGGPFDKEGAVGKQFTTDGAIGGTVQKTMGGTSKSNNNNNNNNNN